jgi:hypothetical protein
MAVSIQIHIRKHAVELYHTHGIHNAYARIIPIVIEQITYTVVYGLRTICEHA